MRPPARFVVVLAALTIGCKPASADRASNRAALVRVRQCNGPARSLSPIVAALLRRDASMRPNDQDVDLARAVPGGYAGVILSNGQLTVLLTDTAKAAEAKRALAPKVRIENYNVSDAVVRQARWDSSQLFDWYHYLTIRSNFWWDVGITSSGVAVSLNRIQFGVEDETSRARLVERLERVRVPCDLVVVAVEGPAVRPELLPAPVYR